MEDNQENYKVLIVDDEPIILRSLKAAIPWNELQMEIVGEAQNGEVALKFIKETSPHIVISDIRMPVIDGITLMKEVLANNNKLLFIFISGYGEFEYAREALRQGAFDYLLKPIDHDELAEMLNRARTKLDEQRQNEQMIHSVQMLSLLARERMFADITLGHERSLEHLKWLESSELESGYFMAVAQLDAYSGLSNHWNVEEKRLWLFAIRNIIEEWSLKHGALTVFPFHNGEWIVLFPASLNSRRRELGEQLIKAIQRHTKLSCSVGISRCTQGIGQLSRVYPLAAKALYQRFYSGLAGVFLDEETPLRSDHDVKYPKELEAELIESIRNMDREQMRHLLDELSLYIESQSFSKEIAEYLLIELVVILYRHYEHLNSYSDWTLYDLLGSLHNLGTLKEMIQVIQVEFGKRLEQGSKQGFREDAGSTIEKAKRYIETNYHKDLSIEEVSELADLSISHFCTLFKQITGYTFLEYVTHCRMERAKLILQSSNVKVYQIAPLVGYQDPRYFTQVFKKASGKTPSEYREERTKQANS